MTDSIYSWSTTASANGNADSDINFAEGQAPSTLNNSNRQVMGRVAEFLDDLGSNVTVGGTANAITVTAKSAFSAYSTGLRLVFKAASDNSDATTLNVNSIGAKSLRKVSSTGDAALAGGEIQSGSLYEVIYSSALDSGSGGWQLMNLPEAAPRIDYVPIGAGSDYWGTTAPTGWIFAYGQAISRSTYADLFAVLGETYGSGDGSTTFNVPDKRGRASFGKDDMGGTSANRITDQSGGWNGDTLGDTGGAETVTLATSDIPSHTHAAGTLATASSGAHTHTVPFERLLGFGFVSGGGTAVWDDGSVSTNTSSSGAHTHTMTGSTGSTGSGGAHNNLPPGIVCNYIIFAGV
jgi:microcystin-dependent protein